MPNTFFRKTSANVGTTATTVGGYTVPGSTTTVVLGLSMANDTGATINATAFISNATALTYLVRNAPVSAGGTLVIVGGDQKIVMITGDKMYVQSSAATSIDAILSIMEIT